MKRFMKERGFFRPVHLTNAKIGEICDQRREASPALHHRLKQEFLSLCYSGLVLIRLAELKQRMEMTLRGENFELAELEAVVGLLAGPGMIKRLDFGGFILLRPEVLSRYAAAVVRKVRKHPQDLGCIRKDELLAGDLDYQDFKRLPYEDEAAVLRTLLETFINRAWCLRRACDGSRDADSSKDQESALGQLLAAAGLRRHAGHPHVGWRNPLDGRERLEPAVFKPGVTHCK
jgi:hypothetical protein